MIYNISTQIAVRVINKNLSGHKNPLEQSINDNEASSSKVVCSYVICILKYFITKACHQYSAVIDHWVNLDCTEGNKEIFVKHSNKATTNFC